MVSMYSFEISMIMYYFDLFLIVNLIVMSPVLLFNPLLFEELVFPILWEGSRGFPLPVIAWKVCRGAWRIWAEGRTGFCIGWEGVLVVKRCFGGGMGLLVMVRMFWWRKWCSDGIKGALVVVLVSAFWPWWWGCFDWRTVVLREG